MSKVFTITEGLENMGAIKTGGQGSVYKGRRVGEIITAIKLLPTPIFTQDESDKHYRDFSNEVKKLQRVNEEPNPNVVKILSYGVSETGGFPFIEMEYIDGPDVGELLKEPNAPVFSVKEVIKVAEHLSHALAHCHRLDVKHGDIKSNNVKYNRHTGNYILLDFGLAILSDEERRTSLRHAGAIEFMAPEQNEGRMLFQTDVYSYGIILYELLAGKVPFPLDGNSETARNKVMVAHMEAAPPDILSQRAALLPIDWSDEQKSREMQVPEWLLTMIYKCLEKKPEARFADGIELHDYVSHHRIYTAEVAGLVQHKDHKWKSVVADKDFELQDLKSIVARQDKELEMLRQRPSSYITVADQGKKTVSRSAFAAVLVLLFLVGGLAVYSLFFNRSVVGASNAETLVINDTLSTTGDNDGSIISENRSAAKTTSSKEKKSKNEKPVMDRTTPAGNDVPEEVNDKQPEEQTATEPAPETKADEKSGQEVKKEEEGNNDGSGIRYTVRNKAYFHNEPDANTKREAFIVHWNKAVLKPLQEKDGFVYVVFTNHLGQVSKGWLKKSDLDTVE